MTETVTEEVFTTAKSECTNCDKIGTCTTFRGIVDAFKENNCGGIFKVITCPMKQSE